MASQLIVAQILKATDKLLRQAEQFYDLLEHEGLCLGGSTGINVAGAMKLAKQLGPGHTIATILCDSGTRYASRLFNADFLRSKGLPVPAWLAAGRPALPEGAVVPVPPAP